MRRRDLFVLLGGAAAMWPLAAHAQTPDRLRCSCADGHRRQRSARAVAHLRISARNCRNRVEEVQSKDRVALVRRRRQPHQDYTAELVRLAPDVIVANGSLLVAAMEQANEVFIPIVFVVVNDPVEQGFIPNTWARPGGQRHRIFIYRFSSFGRSLQLLTQIAPGVTRVGFRFTGRPSVR